MTFPSHPQRPGRVEVELPVVLEVSGEAFGGVARNIGIGGMFVAADRVSRIGDEILLSFSIPEEAERVSVRGEVRWVRDTFVSERGDAPGMGIRFLDLETEEAIALAGFIRRVGAAVRSPNGA